MKTKIVVTGALGHIGSAFIHSLSPNDEYDVTLMDDMSAQRYCSLFNLPEGVSFRFVEGDVCTTHLETIFDGAKAVVHLAALTDAATSFDRKDAVERVNFNGTRRVAEACRATGAALIFPSTTSVYGVQQGLVDESCPVSELRPQSPYAETKLQSEQWLSDYQNLNYVILRLGTIFGVSPGMRFHTAVNKFIWQASTGQPLTVWRTAMNQRRPYLSASDAVGAFKHILTNNLLHRHLFNIVTLNASVSEIVNEIRNYIPGLRVELVDERIMNQLSYEVSSARFQKTEFVFSGDLARDVHQTIKLFRFA